MNLALQAMAVATGSDDRDGMLVLADDELVAVLVRLSDSHGGKAGLWFLEHGFAVLKSADNPVFADLDAAGRWVLSRLRRAGPAQLSS